MVTGKRNRLGPWLLTIVVVLFMVMPVNLAYAQQQTPTSHGKPSDALQKGFEKAAKEFGVPLELLMSVAYNETRWDGHNGEPSTSGGYGVMHLTQVTKVPAISAKGERITRTVTDDPKMHTLDTAAKLIGISSDTVKTDPAQNIRGGAALLAKYARETADSLSPHAADWYGAVVKYSGSDVASVAKDFADQVYKTIKKGAERTTPNGQHVVLKAKNVTANKETAKDIPLRNAKKAGVDCPNGLECEYIPAAYKQFSSSSYNYGNYDLANRPKDGLDINYIIIHDIEGSYQDGVNTFLGQSYVSAHYVIRSTDGHTAEMVRPRDVAWQAGNWYFNSHSIGIEHGGVAVDGASWYSEQMYHASAKLVKYLAKRFDIPMDSAHILGHENVPGLSPSNQSRMHWDPAAYWDWAHFYDVLGSPIHPQHGKNKGHIVTIKPNFHTNKPVLTYGGKELDPQSANFVYLRTAPDFDAPLLSDQALHSDGAPGTTNITDWGDKAMTGQSFYKADSKGKWTAIYFAGQKAWFYNPHGKNAVPSKGLIIQPKDGKDSIPVYGSAYPEAAAYEGTGVPAVNVTPLQYTIPAGQRYAATGPIQPDYYYAKIYNAPETNKVVEGNEEYYQISFNHRAAFVKKSDVEVVRDKKK
ncbi:N-acetylmuramoyl-L-alanine amidase [Scopulibacillus darangshiensis]|uniref:N-acetylmuramoyl-L-alanine amidase n=1 Tax=Scopulibacillus darangshiensis TaxID=442528 RepID=A0A4V6NQP4_9BACL|nr:N-acetylmuramoyl-L-alanine amidase [Scopulibacillus darangshiensis]TCP29966.1 N-acetylmuramoyl-L-alanine amidase [Scopulibacillus darangshiensis]